MTKYACVGILPVKYIKYKCMLKIVLSHTLMLGLNKMHRKLAEKKVACYGF